MPDSVTSSTTFNASFLALCIAFRKSVVSQLLFYKHDPGKTSHTRISRTKFIFTKGCRVGKSQHKVSEMAISNTIHHKHNSRVKAHKNPRKRKQPTGIRNSPKRANTYSERSAISPSSIALVLLQHAMANSNTKVQLASGHEWRSPLQTATPPSSRPKCVNPKWINWTKIPPPIKQPKHWY